MRWSLAALMAIGVMAATDMVPAEAATSGNLPFCIAGCNFSDGPSSDCSFTTYEQCKATASGQSGYCYSNPYYTSAEAQPARGRFSRRRY